MGDSPTSTLGKEASSFCKVLLYTASKDLKEKQNFEPPDPAIFKVKFTPAT
jgi:hypothetical protein